MRRSSRPCMDELSPHTGWKDFCLPSSRSCPSSVCLSLLSVLRRCRSSPKLLRRLRVGRSLFRPWMFVLDRDCMMPGRFFPRDMEDSSESGRKPLRPGMRYTRTGSRSWVEPESLMVASESSALPHSVSQLRYGLNPSSPAPIPSTASRLVSSSLLSQCFLLARAHRACTCGTYCMQG